MNRRTKPTLYVLAAPSGGGKTSLIGELLKRDDRVRLSISYTTREARPGEIDGVHYHFITEADFLKLIQSNALLEHARVFDHRYGTGREAVERQLASGFDVLLDIDWQGARQIRESYPSCCTIFIVPPSLEALRKRLVDRGQDEAATIERRMKDARTEISHWDEFDYTIVNDTFDEALADLHSIIRNGKPQRVDREQNNRKILAELMGTG